MCIYCEYVIINLKKKRKKYIWVWNCPLNLFILQVAVEMIEMQCLFQGCSVWTANI